MQTVGPHPRTSISETQELRPSHPCVVLMLTFENYCSEPLPLKTVRNAESHAPSRLTELETPGHWDAHQSLKSTALSSLPGSGQNQNTRRVHSWIAASRLLTEMPSRDDNLSVRNKCLKDLCVSVKNNFYYLLSPSDKDSSCRFSQRLEQACMSVFEKEVEVMKPVIPKLPRQILPQF